MTLVLKICLELDKLSIN